MNAKQISCLLQESKVSQLFPPIQIHLVTDPHQFVRLHCTYAYFKAVSGKLQIDMRYNGDTQNVEWWWQQDLCPFDALHDCQFDELSMRLEGLHDTSYHNVLVKDWHKGASVYLRFQSYPYQMPLTMTDVVKDGRLQTTFSHVPDGAVVKWLRVLKSD